MLVWKLKLAEVIFRLYPVANYDTDRSLLEIFRWQPVGAMIVTLLSQAIMASRVYAVSYLSALVAGHCLNC